MYRPKYYFWLGLGTGLIIGALLLQLMVQSRDQVKLEDFDSVEKAADRLGYRLVPQNEGLQIEVPDAADTSAQE